MALHSSTRTDVMRNVHFGIYEFSDCGSTEEDECITGNIVIQYMWSTVPVQSRMSEELTALLCHGIDVRFLARLPQARPLH